ncbi:LodA/GoxA family CTQ-dependent oxidase [Polyangium mundeleinium]|uniref:LodA/GoxA family CTQ-dependent oxidase n=1 Tax=Polyangium mundeleinium TaxID=2995306 RepID=A0ABT5F1Q9_9BACT|nr:LodA/GoxA family CTQ-dependent oxidase [Polyangium mundeleinium]MDC0748028.1 LodA/GoxA family CTQ-dependent oxidase [Polyangium mundeleinium]
MIERQEITQFAIYPSIGVARVGNSADAYFFGPEQPGVPRADAYRDASGCIKRQAARFRVYGLDANGNVVKEITADDARITWKVEVANKKAAWFNFDQALDILESQGLASTLRNPTVKGPERASLAITPPPVTISGKDVNSSGDDASLTFHGRFFGKSVYLGELRTDAAGRLVFLGGRGEAASVDNKPATTFANNTGWHDDTSDGPVDASIEYNGKTYTAKGAWVVVGPPDYAPGLQGIVTGWDLLFQVATEMEPARMPQRPKFSEHIYPLLRRFSLTQWVNAGFARDFGFGTPSDFTDPVLVARLNDPSDTSRSLRTRIFDWFRNASYDHPEPAALPGYYGDAMTGNATKPASPREWMAILPTQYRWLEQWAEGHFEADGPPAVPPAWESLSAAEQVRGIDRAVLDEVLGGPFHPGAEFTWPMRNKILYVEPFRIKRRANPEPDWGPQLISSIALGKDGPLDGSTAGDITRWMATPWQTDTSSCLSAYVPYVDDYLPTFWPARVPNDVLSEKQYEQLIDPDTSPREKERVFAFEQRVKWLRGIRYPMRPTFPPQIYPSKDAINKFIREWALVGIVEPKPGPGGLLPREVWVETGRQIEHDQPTATALAPIWSSED